MYGTGGFWIAGVRGERERENLKRRIETAETHGGQSVFLLAFGAQNCLWLDALINTCTLFNYRPKWPY